MPSTAADSLYKEERPQPGDRVERLGGGVELCVDDGCSFGVDAFLLSHFATPKADHIACDLCSGCGIVPFLWFRGKTAPRAVLTVDIQPDAARLQRLSAARSHLTDRLFPHLADLRQHRNLIPKKESQSNFPADDAGADIFRLGGMHLVTCNPPYFPDGSGRLSNDSSPRLSRHEVACTLEDVCAAAAALLRFGGRFCVCYPPARLADLLTAMRAARLEPKRLRMVQRTASDAPWLVLAEGRLGGKPSLQMEPPLLMRRDGADSPEIRRLYGGN